MKFRIILLLVVTTFLYSACEKILVQPDNKVDILDLNFSSVSIKVSNIECEVYKSGSLNQSYNPQYNYNYKDTVNEISSVNLQFSKESDSVEILSNIINFKYSLYKNEGPSTSSVERNLSIEFDFSKKLITYLKASISQGSSYGPGSWANHDQRSESNSKSVELTNLPYIVDSLGNISANIVSTGVQDCLLTFNFSNNSYNYDWDPFYPSSSSNSKHFMRLISIPDSATITINVVK